MQFNRYAYLPTVDRRVIPSDPKKYLENVVKGTAAIPNPVPYLTGVNQNDGTQVLRKPFIHSFHTLVLDIFDNLNFKLRNFRENNISA